MFACKIYKLVMKNLILLLLLISPFSIFGQSYKNWKNHDVIRFYEKIDLDYLTLDENGEEIRAIFVPTQVKNGTYDISVTKVSSKLYQVRGSNIYMYFRFTPFLFTFDEGILEVSGSSGTFFEKP